MNLKEFNFTRIELKSGDKSLIFVLTTATEGCLGNLSERNQASKQASNHVLTEIQFKTFRFEE